jgi:hypothetical protein
MSQSLSLEPDPRLLPMLGEIDLPQERCLAELVDNSIDGFLKENREDVADYTPQVSVELPTTEDDATSARILVSDNGPGMTTDLLEKAVKAGWTGNDPISNLGLFGMGFNIATARLGRIIHVWTTMRGEDTWRGIEIDFFKLIENGSFITDLLTRSKNDPSESGTEIEVSNLKSDQVDWFQKLPNHGRVKTFFSKIYSTMLRSPGHPIHFRLLVSGKVVKPVQHCVWGNGEELRSVNTTKYGRIDAFQPLNITLEPKKYCIKCWSWAIADSEKCHVCGAENSIVERKRRITGWLGILRYLSETDYGIDHVRNGRKIELQDRSLFQWELDGVVADEYPIDDPRRRGRIVGEIHLDHCRVSYTKDRFDRDDSAWKEMKEHIRGLGPLRPDKAMQLGYTQNVSPLFLLFQAFRRSTPTSKVAGAYENLLAVKNNELAKEFSKKYHAGEAKYFTDDEWFKLVQEADKELLVKSKQPVPGTDQDSTDDELDGILDTSSDEQDEVVPETEPDTDTYDQERLAYLSRDYIDDKTAMRFEIEAYGVGSEHPKLRNDSLPWFLEKVPRGTYNFIVDRDADIFNSTFEPLEALIAEMAHTIIQFSRDHRETPLFAEVYSGLRRKYVTEDEFDAPQLIQDAEAELKLIARFISSIQDGEENIELFSELSAFEKNSILSNMALAGISDSNKLISDGIFLEYAPPYSLIRFIEKHPEIYFDGSLWDVRFNNLTFDDLEAQQLAREGVVRQFSSLLSDLFWLTKHSLDTEDPEENGKLIRAKIALDTLRSYREEE